MAGPAYEIKRSYDIFRYLNQFPWEAQRYIRRLMRDALKRDRIVSELQLRELIRIKAHSFGGDETPEGWEARQQEAKKQITDLYFAANYSLDHLKYLVAENAAEFEGAFNLQVPDQLDFSLNLETANVDVLIQKMYQFESLGALEKARVMHEIQELRIVLIQRLISEQPEFVRVAHKFLSISDIHTIYDRIVGTGRVGGKSAGMFLAYRILVTPEEGDPYDFSRYFGIPNSYYVGDDVFHAFLDYNGLLWTRNQKFKDMATIEAEYTSIRDKILAGHFQVAFWEKLRQNIQSLGNKPIIVRSSSLLEDNFGLSFAGKYDSFFLPNQGSTEQNLEALSEAIKKIYAGVFSPDAMAYRRRNEIVYRYESMAILIQEVEGKRHGRYYLPDLAGVLFSENPYCWTRRIAKEDGMLRLVYGLGTRAVDRVGEDYPRMVALGQPTLRPEPYATLERYSQKYLDVIDLEAGALRTVGLAELVEQGLDGSMAYILSSRKEDRIQEAYTTVDLLQGKPVITFDRLLGKTQFAKVLRAAMSKIRRHYGMEIDIEMAAEIASTGQFKITMLQCRPQSLRVEEVAETLPEDVPEHDVVFSCVKDIPNGRVDNVGYVVYVSPEAYARVASAPDRYEVARVIGRINMGLEAERAILLGPGRWGSSNVLLGVPVKYYEINNFKLLGEVARRADGATPEVSHGTHFFQDLVEAGIHCIPIYPGMPGVVFNSAFLDGSPNVLDRFVPKDLARRFGRVVRVIELNHGRRLQVLMNGKLERAIAFVGPARGG